LLHGVRVTIGAGERVVIAGPSGAGKTTLLRAIAGLVGLSGGELRFDGIPASVPGRNLLPPHRRGVAMVFQDLGLWPALNVRRHLLLAPRPPGVAAAQHRAAAHRLMDQLGLTPYARRRPGSLSGGEQQRLALGAALMGNPRALLLDEPFHALDPVLKDELVNLVDERAARSGCAVICVTHDVHEARELRAQRFIVVEAGRLAADLPWEVMASGATTVASPTLAAWRQRLSRGA
jgi:ABC-type sugar transport system ATPase subunit